jgi:hypothetical protein
MATKRVLAKLDRSRTSHIVAKFQFILTELQLAITFCEMALSSEGSAKMRRNFENATRAHNAAIHFLGDGDLTTDQQEQVQEELGKLEPMLREAEARSK